MAKKQADAENQPDKSAPKRNAKARTEARDSKGAKAQSRPNPLMCFIRYVEACRAELRKVTWPNLKETRKATIAVLAFVGIMAVILGLIDLGLSSLIKAILS